MLSARDSLQRHTHTHSERTEKIVHVNGRGKKGK